MPPGQIKKCWGGGKDEGSKRFLACLFCFTLCLSVCFLFGLVCFFIIFFGGSTAGIREEYRRTRSAHMSEIKVHDVKLPKNQQRNYVFF